MQQKTSESGIPLYWQHIEDFKNNQGLTWQDVADKIDVTVAMLMMVKAGKRKLGRKAMQRFREFKRAAVPDAGLVLWPLKASQESLVRLSQTVDRQPSGAGYLRRFREFSMKEFGDAAASVSESDVRRGRIRVQVENKTGVSLKGFPTLVELVSPNAKQSASALVGFLSQIEERELLFACLESKWRNADFFDQLLTTSAYALCHAACKLIVSSYDERVESELQAQWVKLDTNEVVTAHEALLHERDRLRMFYPEFYDFVSPILNTELARRLKLDYKSA